VARIPRSGEVAPGRRRDVERVIAEMTLPVGTVTFVLGDMASSTRLWEQHPDVMPAVLGRIDVLAGEVLVRHQGARPAEQGEGDNLVAAFGNASDAIRYAAELQAALVAEPWPDGIPVALRMAVHTGDARLRDGGRYMGEALNRCARLRALGHGGQVLLSAATSALVVEHLADGLFLRDLGSHHLRDLSQPDRIAQLCGPGLPFDFPALRALDRTMTNLPTQITSFVGRAAELAETTLLIGDRRMLTLAGAGGCGKTRLSLQLAAEVLDSFPDGVWFADLGPLTDPDLVAATVAAVAGVRELPGRAVLDTVADRLAGATALVVLDNCEHLLDACAGLAETLLHRCPGVRVLATSREPLGVEGETTYRIPSLGLPAADDDASCESVTLFAERAALARPTLRMGPAELAAAAAICRRLDGIPLAIELAAARCRALTPGQIAERLGEHFDLLTGGSRRALPRHRALEASVEWSYNLLTDDERRLLQRLAVFAGGFDLTAAEVVSADSPEHAWAVVDQLTGLVDKSLVLQEESGRYRLLETVRQFAEARLAATGDAPAVRRRHAEHFQALAAAAEADLYGPGIAEARRRLRPDTDNFRAAAEFAVAEGDADLALGVLVPLDLFWQATLVEARERITRALAVPGGTPELRMRGFATAAEIDALSGAFDGMAASVTAGLALADGATDPLAYGWLTEQLGWVRFLLGEEGGETAAGAGLEILRSVDDPRARYYILDALFATAWAKVAQGHTAEGLARNAEAYTLACAGGGPLGIGRAGGVDGVFRVVCGDLTEAPVQLAAAVHTLEECGDGLASWFAVAEILAAGLAGDESVPDRLRGFLSAARADQQGFAIAWGSWGLALLEARLEPSPPPWRAAVDEAETGMAGASFRWGGPWMKALRAQHLAREGDVAGARAEADAALAAVEATTERTELARGPVELARARIALAEGDPPGAEDCGQRALAALVAHGLRLQAVEALEFVATLAVEGSPAEAARLLAAAAGIRAGLPYPPSPAEEARLTDSLERLRKLLAPDAMEAAWVEGSAMALADAAAYAARGRGPRRRPSTGWNSLTPTELSVVGLVAAGLRNPEIAAKLFVSPETVKTHVSNALAKLGVSNRTELAALAARRG
jgi:predicted ATPase/class 3 adenylate cyclase/DNA-binding CsgD family transcriptional regulator